LQDPKGMILIGVAMIFLAVGFIIYPICLDATDSILSWNHTSTAANLTVSTSAFTVNQTALTGMAAVTGILPLIILLGFVTAGAITGFMGYKQMMSNSAAMSPKNLMMMSIGLIFLSVSLIIFPVILDGIASAYETVAASLYTYTGLLAILRVVPLIVLTAFLAGGIVPMFFSGREAIGKGKAKA